MSEIIPFNKKLYDTGKIAQSGKVEQHWENEIIKNVFGEKRVLKEIAKTNNKKKFKFYDPEFLMKTFNLSGFEFGNWLSQEDRYIYMAGCAYAMKDFCDLHKIPYNKFGFNDLKIAFGARGTGGSLAHFEPGLNVINLTRHRDLSKVNKQRYMFGARPLSSKYYDTIKYDSKNGAGSLGHEYAHAFDYHTGRNTKNFEFNFASESIKRITLKGKIKSSLFDQVNVYEINKAQELPKNIQPYFDLMKTLMFQEKEGVGLIRSEWYGTLKDKLKSDPKKGEYWAREVELFARSFEVYLFIRCKKEKIEESFLKKKKYNNWLYPSENFLIESGAYSKFEEIVRKFFKT